MEYETLRIETQDAIAIVTLNRPAALNALNSTVLKELAATAAELAAAAEVHAVVLTGAGDRAFVAGADIKEMVDMGPLEARAFMHLGQSALGALERLPQPIIAAVNGFALGGGCELALACDFIIASEKARFGLPEVTLGLFPGFGGTQRLARLVGRNWAKQLILTGEMITAQQALQIGLVNELCPPGELLARAVELGKKIGRNAPLAVQAAKRVINTGLETDLGTGLMLEADVEAIMFATKDRSEGMTAFIEKRGAAFVGK